MIPQQSTCRLRIAYLTQLDPLDKRCWSGGLYYMEQALQRHCGHLNEQWPEYWADLFQTVTRKEQD